MKLLTRVVFWRQVRDVTEVMTAVADPGGGEGSGGVGPPYQTGGFFCFHPYP